MREISLMQVVTCGFLSAKRKGDNYCSYCTYYCYDWCTVIIKFQPCSPQCLQQLKWLEHPDQNLEGREFSSHLELGIFSELPGLRILLLPNQKVCVLFQIRFFMYMQLFIETIIIIVVISFLRNIQHCYMRLKWRFFQCFCTRASCYDNNRSLRDKVQKFLMLITQ